MTDDGARRLTALKMALARASKMFGPASVEAAEARRDYTAALAAAELSSRLDGEPLTSSQLDTLEGLVAEARDRTS
jgi:hypothetical protein